MKYLLHCQKHGKKIVDFPTSTSRDEVARILIEFLNTKNFSLTKLDLNSRWQRKSLGLPTGGAK